MSRLHPRIASAAIFAAAFIVVYGVAIRTTTGQRIDSGAFAGPTALGGWSSGLQHTADVIRFWTPAVAACLVGLGIVAALVGGRPRSAVVAVVVPSSSFVIAELLKRLLSRPYLGDLGYVANTFPSGHTAISAGLVVALWRLAPPRSDLPARVPAAVCAAVSYCSYFSFAHRPSDVVGGLLIVGAVSMLLAPGTVSPAMFVRPRLRALLAAACLLAVLSEVIHVGWYQLVWTAACVAYASAVVFAGSTASDREWKIVPQL